MANDRSASALLSSLMKLRSELAGVLLGLETPGVTDARATRSAVVDQLDDYILPRLVQLDAPLLTVVGGSTGAGKSTLVNSLVGARVTESGVLRPTTRSPVLVHNPADGEWFAPDRILPELKRTTTSANDVSALRLVAAHTIPQGLAVLDAPDVDSIDVDNRKLAAQLLAAADLWLFVTSAARYADEVPWSFLRAAAERSTAVAVVLDRTSTDSIDEVRVHLARMLTSRGLQDSPLFTVLESTVDEDGLLDPKAVAPILRWLHDLASEPETRAAVVAQTLDGAVRQTVFSAYDVADATAEQAAATTELESDVDTAYRNARSRISDATADGSMLRGEILARWQDFVGTGDLVRSLETRTSKLRERVADSVRGRRTQAAQVQQAIGSALHLLLVEHAEHAAEATERAWVSRPAGTALVTDAGSGLDRASRAFRSRAQRVVQEWQEAVVAMVRTEATGRRMSPKFLSVGVGGFGVALMVATLTRSESHDDEESAGSAARMGRQILEAVFGDQVVRRLATLAHEDLLVRVDGLLGEERQRYGDILASKGTAARSADTIRKVARSAEDARHTDLLPDDWDH